MRLLSVGCASPIGLPGRHDQFEHVGPLERVNAAFAQQPYRVQVGSRRQAMLLCHAPRHTQLAACQPFAADGVQILFAADFGGAGDFTVFYRSLWHVRRGVGLWGRKRFGSRGRARSACALYGWGRHGSRRGGGRRRRADAKP